jgi:hypothetical protein
MESNVLANTERDRDRERDVSIGYFISTSIPHLSSTILRELSYENCMSENKNLIMPVIFGTTSCYNFTGLKTKINHDSDILDKFVIISPN